MPTCRRCLVLLAALLGLGVCAAFAADAPAPAVPDGFKGFRGMLRGTVVAKTDNGLTLKVEQVLKTWKQSEAKEAASAVGKELKLVISTKSRLAGEHRQTLAGLKAGDRVDVEVFNTRGDLLEIIEALNKTVEEKK